MVRHPAARSVAARSIAPLLLAGVASCSGDATGGSVATVRDSAGVTIVESPTSGIDLGWALDTVPLLDIGTLDGPSGLQLFRVRDAHRLADGGVAVLNAGTHEVRLYGPDGAHRLSFGGEGQGPGEFSSPASLLEWAGDSLAVWDGRTRRVTVFARNGTFGRTVTWSPTQELGLSDLSHRLTTGEFAVTSLDFGDPNLEGGGYVRPPVRVSHVDSEGRVVADLGSHPGQEAFMRVSPDRVEISGLPFARGFFTAAHGDQTIIAATEALELRYYDRDGSLARVARVLEPPRPITEADRQTHLAGRLASAPEQAHAGLRALYREHPGPDTLPAFTEFGDDRLGNTWIRTFRSPADTGPDRWIVLDAEGAALGSVELPPDIDVYEIGADWVLGRWTDDFDVEHVRLWRLRGRQAGG